MSTSSSQHEVLARYGNWYHGADDLFAHGLILRNGHCVLIFQGLQSVTVEYRKAPDSEHDQLVNLLAQPIDPSWPPASYTGFNFITDAEGPDASEIAVYGVQTADNRPAGEYYAAPASSQIGGLVKQIAQVD